MSDKYKEEHQEIHAIMKDLYVPESDRAALMTAFSLGMDYAVSKLKSYAETNNLLKGMTK